MVLAPIRPAAAETAEVTAANLAFAPATVSLKLTGGEAGIAAPHAHVIWTMADPDTKHTVTFDDRGLVSSEPLAAGQRHEVVLYAPGTYTYHCTIHPTMTGSLVVTPGPPEPSTVATAPVRSPDAREPDVSSGSGSGSGAALVAIGLSALATAAVLAWYLIRRRQTGVSATPDGGRGPGSTP
jgi:plastocyanin